MHEVIQKIMAAEAEAKRTVLAAKAEAEQLSSGQQKCAQELTAAARKEAQLETQNILATAIAAADENRQRHLAAVAAEMEKEVRLDEVMRKQAVAAVVRCVCG